MTEKDRKRNRRIKPPKRTTCPHERKRKAAACLIAAVMLCTFVSPALMAAQPERAATQTELTD